jgi:hypothetical protein
VLRIFVFLLVLFSSISTKAQGEDGGLVSTPYQFWNELAVSQGLSKKFAARLSLEWNTSNSKEEGGFLTDYLTNYGMRGMVHYFIKPKLRLSASFSTYINPSVPELKQQRFVEYKPSVEAQYFWVDNRFTLFNRLRYESRFLHNTDANTNRHIARLRYMPKLFVSLNSKTIRAKTLYLILSDELVFDINNKDALLDQNRLSIGLGYCFTNHVTLESAVVNRIIFHQTSPNELTNALNLTLIMNNLFNYNRSK